MAVNGSSSVYDCFHDPPEVQPYNDISGIGVLTGFLGTGYIAVAIIGGYYLFAFDPERNPFKSSNDDDEEARLNTAPGHPDSVVRPILNHQIGAPSASWRPNPIDRHFLKFRRIGRGWLKDEAKHKLDIAFTKCMLRFCDAQLLTGLGILVSAYGTLYSGISAYHWQAVIYLAWFANLTHISTLTFLRNYLQQHRKQRNWRVVSMAALLVLLIVAEVPTLYFNWSDSTTITNTNIWRIPSPSAARPESYAHCYFNMSIAAKRFDRAAERFKGNLDGCKLYSSSAVVSPCEPSFFDSKVVNTAAFQNMLMSVLLLVFTTATRIVKLSRTLSAVINGRVRGGASRALKRLILAAHRWTHNEVVIYLAVKPLLALLITLRLSADLYTSMLSEVYWLVVSAIWGTIHLFIVKNSATVVNDSELTFGQILPIFLLVGPLVPILVMLRHIPKLWTQHQAAGSRLLVIGEEMHRRQLERQVEQDNQAPGPSADNQEPDWLRRDYYSSHWMSAARDLAICHIIFLSVLVLWLLADNVSAVKTLSTMVLWVLVTQPFAAYGFVLMGLAAEGIVDLRCGPAVSPGGRKRWNWIGITVLILSETLLPPVYSTLWGGSFSVGDRNWRVWTLVTIASLEAPAGYYVFCILRHWVRRISGWIRTRMAAAAGSLATSAVSVESGPTQWVPR